MCVGKRAPLDSEELVRIADGARGQTQKMKITHREPAIKMAHFHVFIVRVFSTTVERVMWGTVHLLWDQRTHTFIVIRMDLYHPLNESMGI